MGGFFKSCGRLFCLGVLNHRISHAAVLKADVLSSTNFRTTQSVESIDKNSVAKEDFSATSLGNASVSSKSLLILW